MVFPIGDDQVKGGYFPFFSYAFIAINVLVFLYQMSLSEVELGAFIDLYAAKPADIQTGQNHLSLLTSMFLHGGLMHLLGNMIFLWIFADNIEATIGNMRFLLFYLIGGLAAHAGHIYFNLGSEIPTVGASGAISAVMGAYLVMFPTSRIKMLVFIFITRIPAFLFLGFWAWQQWSFGQQSLLGTSNDNVAWWAHIGGFVFGVVAGVYYRMTYPRGAAPATSSSTAHSTKRDLL
jgi:membrane associated rhomboid family serine protease